MEHHFTLHRNEHLPAPRVATGTLGKANLVMPGITCSVARRKKG